MTVKKKYTAPSIFGDVSVFFQRALIAAYYALLFACLWAVDWQQYSLLSFVVVLYVGLLVADFGSGLVHLYIDYRPLNNEKNYDKLYNYSGDRGSEEFGEMKKGIVRDSSWFDHTVYAFKLHHRDAGFSQTTLYRDFFVETAIPGFMLLCFSLFVLAFFPEPWSSYLAFFWVVCSLAALHSDIIHAWVHGSKTMPRGVKFIRFFLKHKLMYSVKTHALHHKDGLTGFCFVMGHTNFAVNWICKKLLERGIIHIEDWYGVPRADQSNHPSVQL